MNNDDIELVLLAQENNEDAKIELYEKYKPLLVSKSSEVFSYLNNKGLEKNDVYQEVLLAFESAINEYEPEKDVSFYTFFNVCLKNKINSFIVRHNSSKNKILNESLSFDDVDNVHLEIMGNDTEKELLEVENENELLDKIEDKLTKQEYKVFCLKIKGSSIKEIASLMKTDTKTIYNAMQRIKVKISAIIKES